MVTASSPFGIDFLPDPESAVQTKAMGQDAVASESFAPRLILGFGLLLAILAGVAWLVLTQSKRMANSFDQILNNHSFAAGLAAQAIHDSEANNIIASRITAADNTGAAESLRASLEASSQNVDRLIGKLSQTMDCDEERALLKAVLDSRARYQDNRARALAFLFKNPGSMAGRLDLFRQLQPFMVDYQLAWNELLQFELNQTGREAREAKASNQRSVSRMFTLLALAVLAASMVAILTSQGLTRASAARQAAQLALRRTNGDLERRVGERTRELAESTALLDATVGSTGDGILVVGLDGKRLLQNRRTAELWAIPPSVLENSDPRAQAQFIVGATANPQEFQDKLNYYYSHPLEKGVDEIELKDGTILERITGPVFAGNGRNYGRIWTFRDITQRKGMERAVQQTNESFMLFLNMRGMPKPFSIAPDALSMPTGRPARDCSTRVRNFCA